jgi:hypothetical protein
MTVYLVISLPEISYTRRIYIWFWPTLNIKHVYMRLGLYRIITQSRALPEVAMMPCCFPQRRCISAVDVVLASLERQYWENLWADAQRQKGGLITLRTFFNQPDIYGVASFVAECLALFPWFFLAPFGLISGFFQASAQMPPRGIYSDVTLPYFIV